MGLSELDSTEWFVALVICSTCFGHLYVHHQELETTLALLLHVVCSALIAGGRRSGAGHQAWLPGIHKINFLRKYIQISSLQMSIVITCITVRSVSFSGQKDTKIVVKLPLTISPKTKLTFQRRS